MSEYWDGRFRGYNLEHYLQEAINKVDGVYNQSTSDAKAILYNFREIFLKLQEAIKHLNSEEALRSNIAARIQNVATALTCQDFEYYKADKNIKDLLRAQEYMHRALQSLLKSANNSNSKNILDSLKEVFKFVEGIEPVKVEKKIENIDFSEKFKEQEEKLKELSRITERKMAEADKKLEAAMSQFSHKISTYGAEAKTENEKLKELHGIVAGESFTGGYAAFSEGEEKRANIWRGCSVALILLLVLAAMLAAKFIPIAGDTNTFIGQIIKTFSIAGALIYASAFAIRQANQHRKNASRAKWLAVGINAVGAFTGALEEKDKQNARLKMIEVILNQQEGEDNKDSISRDEVMERLKIMTELIRSKL